MKMTTLKPGLQKSSRSVLVKYLMLALLISEVFSCAEPGMLATDDGGTLGTYNQAGPQDTPNATGVGALFRLGEFTGCSVAFLSDRFAVTAARCVAQQPTAPYQIILSSPAIASAPSISVANVAVHPWWNSAEANRASEHVNAVRQGIPGYYQTTPSYDIAILQLATPKTDGVYFERIRSEQARIKTLYFVDTTSSISRSEGEFPVSDITTTTITINDYSLLSKASGGGAAIVTLDNGRAAILGVASRVDDQTQGMMFTQTNPHSNFILDVMMGVYSPSNDLNRYRVEVVGQNPGPNPNPNPNPTPTPSFNCAMMSDSFCDPNCSAGPDPDCMMTQPTPTGNPFGAPCSRGLDCITGLCLSIGDERQICSDSCDPNIVRSCPPQFICMMDFEGEYVCAPQAPIQPPTGGSDPVELRYFGADCMNDAQCSTNVCINHSGGRWCSMRCMQDDDCPVSYVCQPVTGGRACVPPM